MLCLIFLHCPLSGPVLIDFSLLIISCIIEYVTNKRTLNLEQLSMRDDVNIIHGYYVIHIVNIVCLFKMNRFMYSAIVSSFG